VVAAAPTERFGNRVEDYERYRPRYPVALAEWLATLGVGPSSVLADIGAGTGILGELLLNLGCPIQFVEPNAPMLDRARDKLGDHPCAKFIGAPAEATGLQAGSIDMVVAG
jgi:ubiquinone/menaquinone biosynthesis C-methylase UbiE